MSDELTKALRRIAKVSYGATIEEARSVSKTQREAADLIEQQAARLAELEQQVTMMRDGDTCGRACEGTAYRIEARQAKRRIAALESAEKEAVPVADEIVYQRRKAGLLAWHDCSHEEYLEVKERIRWNARTLYAAPASKDAIRREALEDAAICAVIHSQYPITTEYDRGYAKAREDAAAAIRALSQKETGEC